MAQVEGIYCGFCKGPCPLGALRTADCRILQGYECPYFCIPVEDTRVLY